MKHYTQISGAIVVSLVWFSFGNFIGFTTIALPQMQSKNTNISIDLFNSATPHHDNSEYFKYYSLFENDSITIEDISLDEEMGSWFASMHTLTGIILTPFGGYFCELIGRRKMILFSNPCVVIGWVILASAKNIKILFLGRLFSAVSLFIILPAVGVYIAESVHPKIRNNLTILPSLFMAAGTLFVWIAGYFESWRTTAFLCMIPNIIVVLGLIPFPESPYWLIEADKIDLAKKSLQFFRGPEYDITQELNEINEKHQSKVELQAEKESWKWTLKQLTSYSFLKPFSCVGVLYIARQWVGGKVFSAYMVQLLEDSGSSLNPRLGPVVVGSFQLFFAGFLPIIVGKLKPKTMFVISQILETASIIAICVYAFISENQVQDEFISSETLESFGWIPIASIIVLIVISGIGIQPVLHILLNEMYPTNIRTLSIGITQSSYLLSNFAVVKLVPTFLNLMGMSGLCLLYTCVNIFSLIWAAFTIPDNRGKSLVEVENNIEKTQKNEELESHL